jgi:hypothetical protein
MFGVNKGGHAATSLGFSNYMQSQSSFARRFGAEDFHHTPPGTTADAQGQIQREGAGGDNANIGDFIISAQTHDGTPAILFFDLGQGLVQGFRFVIYYRGDHGKILPIGFRF